MDPFRGADKKLSDLMLRGWTMLADSCSSCQCPLMRSPDRQKYCVNCEVWIHENKKREQKKFSELFSSKMNQAPSHKSIHTGTDLPLLIVILLSLPGDVNTNISLKRVVNEVEL